MHGGPMHIEATMAELFWLKAVCGEIFLIPLGPGHLWISLGSRLQLQDRGTPAGVKHCLKSCCPDPDLDPSLLKGLWDPRPWPVEIIRVCSVDGWGQNLVLFQKSWDTPHCHCSSSFGGQRSSRDYNWVFLVFSFRVIHDLLDRAAGL